MTAEEIMELLKFGEHINLECKKAESKIPNSVWETYSSFANTDGGVILFGVDENLRETDFSKRFSFVSIANPEQRLKDFWNTVNGDKVSSNILVDSNVGLCDVNGALIMWIQVPQADYKSKPVFINENPIKGTFKRNHEGDYHCTEEEVKAMLRDANDSGNDGGLLNGYMMSHSDYLITGVLKIVKTDKGFEFSNPGNLKLPVRAIYEGGHSVARNPRIQTMLRMIGYGDNIGSGFPTILKAWGDENWRKPDLSQNEELHLVELKLWLVSLMPRECSEYLQKLYGEAYNHLSNDKQIILATAYLENGVTNTRIQAILNMHGTDVGHILSDLLDANMLLSNRNGRWTSYVLNEEYEMQPEQLVLADIEKDISFKNENDRIVYEYAVTNGFVTSNQVRQITTITSRQGASVALNRLIKQNLLKKTNSGRATIYEPVN